MVPLKSVGTNSNVENHIFQLFPFHSHNYLYYFSGRNPNQFYSLKVSLQQGLFLWELYLEEREVFSLVSPLLLWFLSRLYRLGLLHIWELYLEESEVFSLLSIFLWHKVNSVQEPYTKCFVVHILKFQILQTT